MKRKPPAERLRTERSRRDRSAGSVIPSGSVDIWLIASRWCALHRRANHRLMAVIPLGYSKPKRTALLLSGRNPILRGLVHGIVDAGASGWSKSVIVVRSRLNLSRMFLDFVVKANQGFAKLAAQSAHSQVHPQSHPGREAQLSIQRFRNESRYLFTVQHNLMHQLKQCEPPVA